MHRASVSSQYLVFRCQQAECAKRVTVIRSNLEKYVVEQFLSIRGNFPDYTFEIRRGNEDAQRADLEAAMNDVLDLMKPDGADLAHLMSQLKALKARLVSADRSSPTNAVYDFTGQSVAESWSEHTDIERRQKIIRSHIQAVRVASTRQRGREFDPTRVAISWIPAPENVVLPDGIALTKPIEPGSPLGRGEVGGVILRTSRGGGTYVSGRGNGRGRVDG